MSKEALMRADVQLDEDVLRAATRAVFAESSVDAPLEKIAELSGIDVHTIQSHFINRAALIAFALEEELDRYESAIAHLRGEHKAGVALTLWTQRYVEFLLATRGLAACLSAGTADDDGLAFYFEKRLGTALQALLDEASDAGEMQATQAPHLLLAVAGLCRLASEASPKEAGRLASLLTDGLRYGATAGSRSLH